MGQEVLLPRRDACREREVNLLWRLFLLCQEKKVTQSSVCTLRAQALPPLPRVLSSSGGVGAVPGAVFAHRQRHRL